MSLTVIAANARSGLQALLDEGGDEFLEALLSGQGHSFALRSQPAEAMRNARVSGELRSRKNASRA